MPQTLGIEKLARRYAFRFSLFASESLAACFGPRTRRGWRATPGKLRRVRNWKTEKLLKPKILAFCKKQTFATFQRGPFSGLSIFKHVHVHVHVEGCHLVRCGSKSFVLASPEYNAMIVCSVSLFGNGAHYCSRCYGRSIVVAAATSTR